MVALGGCAQKKHDDRPHSLEKQFCLMSSDASMQQCLGAIEEPMPEPSCEKV